MERQEVYALIDGERAYQDARWNETTTTSGGKHSPTEWLVFIEDYLLQARHIATRESEPQASVRVMDIMRKIGGMAVAAMEQNGAPPRSIPQAG
jgi:hypothetical protein